MSAPYDATTALASLLTGIQAVSTVPAFDATTAMTSALVQLRVAPSTVTVIADHLPVPVSTTYDPTT
jgi:hypothetical protein